MSAQVDLFFYREPEEAKQLEEEEAVVAPDYGIADYSASAAIGGLSADQWPPQISDASWQADVAAPPILAVPAEGWSAEPGHHFSFFIFFSFAWKKKGTSV